MLATAVVGAAALVVAPGLVGEYLLAKWTVAWALVAVLSATIARSLLCDGEGPRPMERSLTCAVVAFAGVVTIVPAVATPYGLAHMTGALRYALGPALALLSAHALSGAPAVIRRGSLVTLAGVGGVCALVAILQAGAVYPFDHLIYQDAEFRAAGTFGNPNWAAAFLLALVPIAAALRRDGAPHRERVLFTALAILMVVGTIATRSKGGMLALAVGMGVFYHFGLAPEARRRGNRWAVLVLLVVLFVVVNNLDDLTRHQWFRGRLFLWRTALTLMAERPWTGTGLGGFLPHYPLGAARIINGDPLAFMPLGPIELVHNDLLQLAVEGGVPALLVFVTVAVLSIHGALRRRDRMSRGIGAGLAAMSAYSLVDAPLQVPASALLFWFMVGAVISGDRQPEPRSAPLSRWGLRCAGALAGVFTVIALIQGGRFAAGNFLWTRGEVAHWSGERVEALEALTGAVRYLPEFGDLRGRRAEALVAVGRPDAAIVELDVALSLQFRPAAAFRRLELMESTRGTEHVIKEWQALSQAFPLLVTPHYHLGRIYWDQGNLDRAAEAFGRIVVTHQDTPIALRFRRQALHMLERIDDARRVR